MANSAKTEKLNLDDYNFGDEFDFDAFSLEPKPVKNKREAVERIAEGAWEGAKDAVKSPSFFREFIKKALPRGFGDMVDFADQSASTVRELYNDGVRETKPMLKDVSRGLDRLMPSASKYLPKAAEKVLKDFADQYRDPGQPGIGANNASDIAIAGMLADTFRYNAKEAGRQEAKNDARETLRDTINNDRFNQNSEQLDGIRKSVVSMAAYQRRVEFNYQKKSLELQARQFFVMADLLNETKRNNLRGAEMLSGILHNTSLPDTLKIKTSEKFKAMLRDKAIGGLQDGIFGQRGNFFKNLGAAFREQALGSLKHFAGGVSDTINGVEMAADSAQMASEMGMDRFRSAGNLVGGEAARWGAKLAGSKFGQKIAGSQGQRAKALRRIGNRMRFFTENTPQIATDWSNTYSDLGDTVKDHLEDTRLPEGLKSALSGLAGFIGNPLLDLAKGTIRRSNAMNTSVKERGLADLHTPTTFTHQTQKSIVEVIPGLLSRMLQEMQIARTGNTGIDLVQYDYARGRFSDARSVRQSTFNRLFDQASKDGIKREKDHLLDLIDPTGQKLTQQQRAELANILMNDNLRGRVGYETGRISNYTHADRFAGSEHGAVYANLFKDLSKRSATGDHELANDFAQRFRGVGRSMNDRRSEIQDLLETYPRDMLEDMGLLKDGSTQIDMAKVNRYFAGEQYQANAMTAVGNTRQRLANPTRGRVQRSMSLTQRPSSGNSSSVVAEIQKLITTIEAQSTRGLTSEIRDILLSIQTELAHGGTGTASSTLDRVLDGANQAGRSAAQGARRLTRRAGVASNRFIQAHQDQVRRQARRLQRQAGVAAGRLQQRFQPQIDQAQAFAQTQQQRFETLWGRRPTLAELGEMLQTGWADVQHRGQQAADYLRSDAFRAQVNQARSQAVGVGQQLRQRVQGVTDGATQAFADARARAAARTEAASNHPDVFGKMLDTLTQIRDRLEDGIITTGGVPPEGLLRRAGGATRRGLSKLNMRLTDLVKGGFNLGIGTARLGSRAVNGMVGGSARLGWNVFKGATGLAGDAIGFAASTQYRRARGFVDIYVGNERKPRLYGRMLQEGNVYFDQTSGKPIRRLRDIVGTVVRHTEKGEEVVLEADEIEFAWQKVGPVKKSLKALGVAAKGAYGIGKRAIGIVGGGIPPVFKMAFWGAKKAWGLLDMAQDIFVKDRLDSPAMTAKLMRAGAYYSATSDKVIKRPSQIDGPVLIQSGDGVETVLTHDDIRKGLVDRNGKPIRTGLGKLTHFAFSGIKRAAGLAWRAGKMVNAAATSLVKGGLKLGRAGISAAVKLGGGTFDVLRGRNPFASNVPPKATAEMVERQIESTNYLKEIRDILRDRLPARPKHSDQDVDGDGIRDGSYDDLMHRAAEAKAQAGSSAARKPGIKAGMKSLWDRARGRGDNDADNAEGDTNISVDSAKDARDAKRARRLARRPGGSWATSKGLKGKAKFLAGRGWGLVKGAGKVGMGLLGLEGLGLGGIVAGAGSAIAAGASALGTGIMAAGGVLASIVSAPVVLGAAAIAAAGVGAYYGYKYLTRKQLGLLSRIRYVQYGFKPTDTDHLAAVFGLEDKLKEALVYGPGGAKLDAKKVDAKALVKDFNVDEKDREAISNWVQWFGQRFKSVFLTHVTALHNVASDKWLSDVDSLEPSLGLKYLNLVRYPDGPYTDATSPFKDLKALPCGAGDVKAIVAIAETELKKKAPESKGGAGVAAGAAVAGVATAAKAAGGAANAAGVASVSRQALAGIAPPVVGAKGAQVSAAGSSVVLQSLGSNKLGGLDVVRFKSYGLVKMELDKVKALQALERYLSPNLTFSKNVANWSGSVEQVLQDQGSVFGVAVSDDDMAKNWISWFNQRFLPVFLNYASLIKAQTGKDVPSEGQDLLKPAQIVDVASALFTTSGSAGSVWNVGVSPWQGYVLNTDVRSTDANLQGLKDMAKTAVLAEPGGKAANQPTAGKSAANAPTVAPSPKSTGILGGLKDFWQSTKAAIAGSPNAKTAIPAQVGNNPMGGTAPAGMGGGREMDHPGKGSGGDINAIPKPTGNKSWTAVKDTILAAAKMVGVDGKLMAAMAAIESGFDYSVKAASTSATGLYQFVSDTWSWMLKKYGAKYGIAPGTLPTDPRANALMGAEYLKENMGYLENKLGRPVTDTDVYFAHFLGSGGALKFLKADPNAVGAQVLPAAAKANPSIFLSKNGGPLSVGQIYQLINNRVRNKAQGLNMDGGEQVVDKASATATGPTPPANGGTAAGGKAPALAAKAPVGLGATTAPTPSLDAKGPALGMPQSATLPPPTNNGIPIGGVMQGFAAPPSVTDRIAQAKSQNDARVVNMETTNQILTKSQEIHQSSFEVLVQIRDALSRSLSSAPAGPSTDATPTSQAARQAPQKSSEVAKPPVSVARPKPPF